MGPILIIDSHSIAHTLKHTMDDLTNDEKKVGIIFGFLKQILSLSKRFDTNKFIFCWDSKKSNRRDTYPTYKQNRNTVQTIEEQQLNNLAFSQFGEIRRKVLPRLGFKNNFIQTGIEADDIIAVIAKNIGCEATIVSTDQDLYQLLTPKISIFSHKTKKLITDELFIENYSITPEEWVKVKQIAGCSTDNVKGINGIGEKRAINFIKNELKTDSVWYNRITMNKEIVDRNEALVKLPYKGTNMPILLDNETFYVANFIEVTDQYAFRSMQQITTLNEWITNFGMV